MTTKLAHPVLSSVLNVVRRSTVVLFAGTLVLLAAGPAGADPPEGGPGSDTGDPAHARRLRGGGPLRLMTVIALLGMGPGRGRGERHDLAGQGGDQWFGGPRQGTAELPPAESTESGAGGASARW